MKTLLGLVLFSSLASASPVLTASHEAPDVFVRHTSSNRHTFSKSSFLPADSSDLANCRRHIRQAVCWVDPVNDVEAKPDDRPCLAGGEKFVAGFEGHFDRSPDLIKKMYCYVDKIWVEKSFQATAYATPLLDGSNKTIAGGIGIRQEVLEGTLPMDDWMSWKEETSFGGSLTTDGPRLGILAYHSNKNTKEFSIDYVLNHEFGHLFDFANDLNRTTACEYRETSPGHWERIGDCKPLPGSWGELSWSDVDHPVPAMDYPFRKDLCFYFCDGHYIPAANAGPLFDGLMNSNFQSSYASRFPTEDWAETFATYLAHHLSGWNYSLVVQGKTYDMSAHFNSPNMATKRAYVESFLRSAFKYPGQP